MPKVIGLDIGASHIRAVEVRTGRHAPTILSAHRVELPEFAASDGQVEDVDLFASGLEQLLDEAKFTTKNVRLVVGNARSTVREIEMPALPLPKVMKALAFEAEAHLQLALSDVTIDFLPVRHDTEQKLLHGLLVATPVEAVERTVAVLSSVGLRVQGVDLTPFAVMRAESAQLPQDQTCLLVHIGTDTSYVTVVQQGRRVGRVRVLATGVGAVAAAVEEFYGDRDHEVLHTMRTVGLYSGQDEELRAVAERMLEEVQEIVDTIRSTVHFWADSTGERVSEIVLSGHGHQVAGFMEAVTELTGLPTRVSSAVGTARTAKGVDTSLLAQHGAEYVPALGATIGA